MKEMWLDQLISWLDSWPSELIVMVISCFPILELRGALPVALELYHMPFWKGFWFSVAGNMIPVLPLLILFQPLSTWMSRFRWYRSFYDWLYRRTMRKSESVERLGAVGLALFVAVPIPTTGAWTACVMASLLHIRKSYAFLAILVGVIIAGLIVGGILDIISI